MPTIPEESYQFKNIILSEKYTDSQSKLTAIIGVDDNGKPILFDFAKQPHLFIGGDQGCGKSTLIHSIIMSLMQRNSPKELQFIYIDPKGLEDNLYRQSKYSLVSKNHHVLDIFNYILHECTDRLSLLSDKKKKTLSSYNEYALQSEGVDILPELFIVLDEVSSFVNETKQYIEQLISRGRTVGIHLIISDANPTINNVLQIAKLIPDKILFRFTYSDYRALSEMNIVPIKEDGEIVCEFSERKNIHGHSCFVSDEEIKAEVAKNIIEIKKAKTTKKENCNLITQHEKEAPVVEKKMPFEALKNKETIDARDYPEYARLLKELGIVDVDKVTEPQTVVVSKTEHKAKLLGISEELAECYGDITLNIQPTKKPSSNDKIKSVMKDFYNKHRTIVLIVSVVFIIALIFLILNLEKEKLVIIGVFALTVLLAVAAVKEMIKWYKYKPETKRNKYSIYAIDNISDGHDFEYVVADLLKGVGFYNVKVTVGSGDFGIDVVGCYGDSSYAIQCKKYSGKVGVSAVQEAYAGRSYYGCDYAMVITNNYFTPAAIELAKSTGVILWDRNNVKKLLNGHI